MTPKVSIVTPSFNQAAYLEETMRSVLEQDYRNLEYIVIDGGSTDGSVGIIERYADRLSYWVSEPDRGQSHAINKGWQRASGEILAWLNSDDLYSPGAVSTAVAALRRQTEADLIYSDCGVLEESTGEIRRYRMPEQNLVGLLTNGVYVPQPTAFLRRSLLDRIGYLDESLHLTLDYHLWLRAFAFGKPVHLSGVFLATMRMHASAKSRAQMTLFPREHLRALDLFYALPNVPTEAQRVKGRAYAQYYYACADVTASVDGDLLRSVGWLARALAADPSLARRLPRAIARTFTGARAGRWS